MGITLEQRGESSVILLEGAIGVEAAVQLKGLLLQACEAGKPVRVALGEGPDLDVTAVQLLWAARRATTEAGLEFESLGKVPEAVALTLSRAGFEVGTRVDVNQTSGGNVCRP